MSKFIQLSVGILILAIAGWVISFTAALWLVRP